MLRSVSSGQAPVRAEKLLPQPDASKVALFVGPAPVFCYISIMES
jgi:hypothetical protein